MIWLYIIFAFVAGLFAVATIGGEGLPSLAAAIGYMATIVCLTALILVNI